MRRRHCFFSLLKMDTIVIRQEIDRLETPSTRPDTTYQRLQFFTPHEVAVHNAPDDLWMSWLGKVYNLTPLVAQLKGELIEFLFNFKN